MTAMLSCKKHNIGKNTMMVPQHLLLCHDTTVPQRYSTFFSGKLTRAHLRLAQSISQFGNNGSIWVLGAGYAYKPINRQANRGRQTLDIRKHSHGHIRMEAQFTAGAQTVPATHAMLKLVGPFANVQFCYSVRLFNVYVLFLRARSIS